MQSDITGTAAIISKSSGSVCLDYARIKDISATGGAFFNGGLSPTRSFDEGGNSGWVFTGASTTFYLDADGDGYGNASVTILSCTPPEGYVTNNTDCNDANAAVHPGATEICNGMDDDCDGLIDENACQPTGPLCLGNRVWNDLNKNGKDENEPGFSNITIDLYKVPVNNSNPFTAGTFIKTTLTNSTGYYTFCNLPEGKYIVVVTTPAGYVRSTVNSADPDNNKDKDNNGIYNNAVKTWGKAMTLTVNHEPEGNTNNTYDLGFQSTQTNKTSSVSITESNINIAESQINLVYPNPFTDKLQFAFMYDKTATIPVSIITANGVTVFESTRQVTNGQNIITIAGLAKIPAGVYLLKIKTGNQTIHKTIVKQ
jgi:hypothetical protein